MKDLKMLDTDTKELAARFEAALNSHDVAQASALFAPGFVDHAPWPGQTPDAAGFTEGLREMITAFPDLRIQVLQTVTQDTLVSWRFTISGTHLGDFMGAPGTGKTFNVEAIDIVRVSDGLIAEHWGVFDAAAMMMQLGL